MKVQTTGGGRAAGGGLFGRSPAMVLMAGFLGLGLGEARGGVDVLTYHNDDARTGQNLAETKLTLANVREATFGKWFSYSVDGFVYAQPLVMTGVIVPGKGVRDLVFVATEHDSVYAFDANSDQGEGAGLIWHASFTDPANGITSVPISDIGVSEPSEIGITGTPVIDRSSGTLYVAVLTKETSNGTRFLHRLHALDVATGAEKFGGPVVMEASITRILAPGDDGGNELFFDSLREFQRPGLVLSAGTVYVTFASAGDIDPYHGWILGYDARTLQLTKVYNDTPNGERGGIWMSGAAPAMDPQGNLYCMTGNGSFDADQKDFGDSFIRLTPGAGGLAVTDYFTPYNQADLEMEDGDLGSGGCLVLPDSAGSAAHPHLLVGAGKEGTIYLLDRDNMGHFNASGDTQIAQVLRAIIGGVWGMPAYFNGRIYFQGLKDYLKAFQISNGAIDPNPVSAANNKWGYPDGTPSISANGTNDAIVWLIQTDTFYQNTTAVLHAYNATNLTEELYDSGETGDRDRIGVAQKFAVPVIANGKVYVASAGVLGVFGNLEAPTITKQPSSKVVISGAAAALEVAASGPPPIHYQWRSAGTAMVGATNAVLAVTNATSETYSVTVSNRYGAVESAEAVLRVIEAPRLAMGDDLELTITGTGGVAYRIESTPALGAQENWQTIVTVTLPGDDSAEAQATFHDPTDTGARRFYRAVLDSAVLQGQ